MAMGGPNVDGGKSLKRGIFLSGLGVAVVGANRLVYNLLVGRIIGPEALGEVSLVVSSAMFLSAFVSPAFGAAAVRYIAENLGAKKFGQARQAFALSYFFHLAGLILLTVLVPLLTSLGLVDIRPRDMFLAVLLTFAYGLYTYHKNAYYGLQQIPQYLRSEVVSTFAFAIVLGIVLGFRMDGSLLLPLLFLNATFVLIAMFDMRHWFSLKALQSGALARQIGRYAAINAVGAVASLGIVSLSIIVTARYVDRTELGYYSAAYTIMTALYLIPRAVNLALFPDMSSKFGSGDLAKLRRLCSYATEIFAVTFALIVGTGILLAWWVLKFSFGPDYVVAAPVLQLVLAATYFSVVSIPSVTLLGSTEYVHVPMLASLVALILALSLWWQLIPRWGITGTAIGYLAATIVKAGLPVAFSVHHFGVAPASAIRVTLLALILLLTSKVLIIHRTWFWELGMSVAYVSVLLLTFRRQLQRPLRDVLGLLGVAQQ